MDLFSLSSLRRECVCPWIREPLSVPGRAASLRSAIIRLRVGDGVGKAIGAGMRIEAGVSGPVGKACAGALQLKRTLVEDLGGDAISAGGWVSLRSTRSSLSEPL